MKYTAISIGPIIDTFSQIRKPRHLWSASFLFSHLMEIIINDVEAKESLISPARLEDNTTRDIGLYPDRAYFKGKIGLENLLDRSIDQLAKELDIKKSDISAYFNIMGLCIESDKESEAIAQLNQHLDVLELANRCENSDARKEVLNLIAWKKENKGGKESPLFKIANKDSEIPDLAHISAISLKYKDKDKWTEVEKRIKVEDKEDEDIFYKELQKAFKDDLKSYHKYFCVVQADGDQMGQVIRNLKEGELQKLSERLIAFGRAASNLVKDFKGLPIYAGGDDLLFIAPVVSKEGNIFDLLNCIDEEYNSVCKKAKELQSRDNPITTSMSYGISINYYKYPLYEALNSARSLLFDRAKKIPEKNAIALEFRKHSGSSFKVVYSKGSYIKSASTVECYINSKIKSAFEDLIEASVSGNLVSTTAHKLRDNTELLLLTEAKEDRLKAFFKKFMDMEEKPGEQQSYLEKVMQLIIEVYNVTGFHESKNEKERATKKEKFNDQLYSMLRIAKFIKGEEVKDV